MVRMKGRKGKKEKKQVTSFASPLRFHHLQWLYLGKENNIQTAFSQAALSLFAQEAARKRRHALSLHQQKLTNSQPPGTSWSSASTKVKTLLSEQLSRFHHRRRFMSFYHKAFTCKY